MADFDAYQTIFDDIKKRLDDPSVIYTLHDKVAKFDPIPSDITVIDEVLNGGLPEGRIIEIFGPEASGKTTLTLHFIAAAQRRDYVVYFIDAEQALDTAYAERIGVKLDRLMFSQPDYGEQALETARAICEATEEAKQKHGNNIKSLIVIDSIPALVPKQAFETYEKDGFDATVALGSQARMLSQLLPPLVNKAGKSGVTVVFINQERDKIGVTYGSPTTTPGGRAVKFFSSLRLKVARIGWYERGGERAGIRTHMLPIKSKLFPIFGRKAEFIIGPDGINQYAALAETLISKGVVSKKGAWMKVDDLSFQGMAKLEDELRENVEFREELVRRLGDLSTQVELKKA
jgi:recombination protein RecA